MPLKMLQEDQDALRILLTRDSRPTKFQPKGIAPGTAASVFEMWQDYKDNGKEGTRFRFDLLYSVPYASRAAVMDNFADVRSGRGREEYGDGLDDDHIDNALKHICKGLFQVHVPSAWDEQSAGRYAEVVGWREEEGARLVKLKTPDGREIEGPEQDLASEFHHELPPSPTNSGMSL